jgi:multicomponent Na+:H+ antiporter subunit E
MIVIRVLLKAFQGAWFLIYFFRELLLANFSVARDVMRPLDQLRPGIVAVPLDLETDASITLLSTLVTLTPGTLTLDVSSDRKVLYIHAMHADDLEALRADIKQGFERRVKELLS